MLSPEELFDAFLTYDGNDYEFHVVRGTVEEGKTFSPEAIQHLANNMSAYVMSRVARRWDETNEPPTALSVKINVEAR